MSVDISNVSSPETETIDDIIKIIEETIDSIYAVREKNQDMTAYEQIEIDTYRSVLILIRVKKSGLLKKLRIQKLKGDGRWQLFE
jgi:hypothetical protein